MEQKLGFLRKYKRNAQLISCHGINKLDCEKIPNSWYELFQEENV
ncbi:SMI1/KNR4 family protein, partial [Klebsiella pneumoniae]|nr:SMI1/KNR4 family protein [Klebsiella pneumoniae]